MKRLTSSEIRHLLADVTQFACGKKNQLLNLSNIVQGDDDVDHIRYYGCGILPVPLTRMVDGLEVLTRFKQYLIPPEEKVCDKFIENVVYYLNTLLVTLQELHEDTNTGKYNQMSVRLLLHDDFRILRMVREEVIAVTIDFVQSLQVGDGDVNAQLFLRDAVYTYVLSTMQTLSMSTNQLYSHLNDCDASSRQLRDTLVLHVYDLMTIVVRLYDLIIRLLPGKLQESWKRVIKRHRIEITNQQMSITSAEQAYCVLQYLGV